MAEPITHELVRGGGPWGRLLLPPPPLRLRRRADEFVRSLGPVEEFTASVVTPTACQSLAL